MPLPYYLFLLERRMRKRLHNVTHGCLSSFNSPPMGGFYLGGRGMGASAPLKAVRIPLYMIRAPTRNMSQKSTMQLF